MLQRLKEAGQPLRESLVECLESPTATLLRIAVEAESKASVERFAKELMPLITAGPPGTTGYAEGRPRVHLVFRYWPCLIHRNAVTSRVDVLETSATTAGKQTWSPWTKNAPQSLSPPSTLVSSASRTLKDLAYGRSGDKGIGANLGIIARRPEEFSFLKEWLTADRIQEFFAADGADAVVRYEIPNLSAMNFVLRGVLRRSLQTDAQGKALAQRLLQMPLPDAE
ncbi:MAG: hypothetical protein U0872_12200 [Planctomycetaceae bacterium]